MQAARDRAWRRAASFFPLVVILYADVAVFVERELVGTRLHGTRFSDPALHTLTVRALERANYILNDRYNDGVNEMPTDARLPVNDEQPTILLFYGIARACRP